MSLRNLEDYLKICEKAPREAQLLILKTMELIVHTPSVWPQRLLPAPVRTPSENTPTHPAIEVASNQKEN